MLVLLWHKNDMTAMLFFAAFPSFKRKNSPFTAKKARFALIFPPDGTGSAAKD